MAVPAKEVLDIGLRMTSVKPKECNKCLVIQPISEYWTHRDKRGSVPVTRYRATCRTCLTKTRKKYRTDNHQHVAGLTRKRKQKTKDIVAEIKNVPCTDCKKKFPSVCMQFDHLPQYEKEFCISHDYGRPLKRILKEIKKCEVVCANCHAIRTEERAGR